MTASPVLIAATAGSVIISILALSVALDRFEIRPAADYAGTEPLSPDAIYLGGATLIGLATFGSVIGIRIIAGKDVKNERLGAALMLSGVVVVIIAQGALMLYACCWGVSSATFYLLIPLTVICSTLIIVAFGHIVETLLKSHSTIRDGD